MIAPQTTLRNARLAQIPHCANNACSE